MVAGRVEPAADEVVASEWEPGWRSRVVSRSLAPAADKAVRRGQELISAASRLILRSGGDEFTVQKVASEAGLTLRAFIRRFPTSAHINEAKGKLAEVQLYH